MMLITTGLCVAAAWIVALSLESIGLALVFSAVVDPAHVASANAHRRPLQNGASFGAGNAENFLRATSKSSQALRPTIIG
jgi:hypothetical protein